MKQGARSFRFANVRDIMNGTATCGLVTSYALAYGVNVVQRDDVIRFGSAPARRCSDFALTKRRAIKCSRMLHLERVPTSDHVCWMTDPRHLLVF